VSYLEVVEDGFWPIAQAFSGYRGLFAAYALADSTHCVPATLTVPDAVTCRSTVGVRFSPEGWQKIADGQPRAAAGKRQIHAFFTLTG
jgi:hypothetical protein